MKRILATATIFALPLSLFGQLADMIDLPEDMAGQKENKFSEEELLRSWGWLLAERFNLKALEISPREIDAIAEGMSSHVVGEEAPTDLQQSLLAIQEYFTQREGKIVEKQLRENRAKEREFFDALFGMPDIKSLGSGLYYQIIERGNEVKPNIDDTVIVRYEGRFLDNTVFDTTEGRPPAAFKLKDVIAGWTQGVQLIGEGGKVKLYVPAKLGYGDEPHPSVPPGSPLVFEIELVKVGLPENPEAEGIELHEPPPPEEPAQQ